VPANLPAGLRHSRQRHCGSRCKMKIALKQMHILDTVTSLGSVT
jgi:hypothetical protein